MRRARRLAVLVGLAGCTLHDNDTPINDVMVAEARIVDATLGSGGIMGGGIGLTGTLEVVDVEGRTLTESVTLSGGMMGFGVTFVGSGGVGEVPLLLPLGGPLDGSKLFGHYEGTYETAAALAGVQTLSMGNDDGVKLETTQFASLFGFELAWCTGELFVVPPPEDSGSET